MTVILTWGEQRASRSVGVLHPREIFTIGVRHSLERITVREIKNRLQAVLPRPMSICKVAPCLHICFGSAHAACDPFPLVRE